MNRSRAPLLAFVLAVCAALLSLVPYLIAGRVTPAGSVFSGFLINPLDGFSYLAKMQQGIQGRWLFELPYAAEPGPPALIFTFYLTLGHLARLVGANPISVFHLVRVAAMILMGLASYGFLRATLSKEPEVWLAYTLVLVGSGLGWLAGPLGWLTSDLLIPESIPFYAGFVNPHFPLAIAGVAAGAGMVIDGAGGWRSRALALALGMGLTLVLPFALLTLLGVLAVWQLWEAWIQRAQLPAFLRRGLTLELGALGALAIGGAPLLAYDFLLTRVHPVLQAWNAQNQTPSPALPSYLLGFGLPLLFAVVGALRRRVWRQPLGRLLLTWVAVNFLLLYAPFNLQRRLSLGLFLPLAALAAEGMYSLIEARPRRRWLPALLIALALPTNGLVMLAGVSQVARGDEKLLLTEAELAGYRWLADNVQERPTVLAAPLTGNRLPAFAAVRVLYGHPFETPRAENRRRQVSEIFRSSDGVNEIREEAIKLGADLIVFGPHEAALGEPAGLSDLPALYQTDGFEVREVSPREE